MSRPTDRRVAGFATMPGREGSLKRAVESIADQVDENLMLASRNLAGVLVIEPRYADPLSLVHYKKVLLTKAAIGQLEEMFA